MAVKRWEVTFYEEANDTEVIVRISDEVSDHAVMRARKRLNEASAAPYRSPYYYDFVSVKRIKKGRS